MKTVTYWPNFMSCQLVEYKTCQFKTLCNYALHTVKYCRWYVAELCKMVVWSRAAFLSLAVQRCDLVYVVLVI